MLNSKRDTYRDVFVYISPVFSCQVTYIAICNLDKECVSVNGTINTNNEMHFYPIIPLRSLCMQSFTVDIQVHIIIAITLL